MLATIATIKVKDGHQSQFEDIAKQLVAAVNEKEPGCKLYCLNKGEDPLTYVFMERYVDEAAVEAHRKSDHFRSLGRAMGEYMDGAPEILRLKEV
jgi:quinol monooxygenase YgiN